MSRVITFSTKFPAYHPRKGEPTYFAEKILEWYFDTQSHDHFNVEEMIYRLNDTLVKSDKTFPSVDTFYNSLEWDIREWKSHTIRAGRRWKVGDKFSPRVLGSDINPKNGKSGPYQSKQIIISPDVEIKKVWDFHIIDAKFFNPLGKEIKCEDGRINKLMEIKIDGYWHALGGSPLDKLSANDGLNISDFMAWFPSLFEGQIICWNEKINY